LTMSAGNDATVSADVAGNASVTATAGDATVTANIGGTTDVAAEQGGNASVTGTLGANSPGAPATITANSGDASLEGDTFGDLTITSAGGDVTVVADPVRGNLTAEATLGDATVDAVVTGSSDISAGGDATVDGSSSSGSDTILGADGVLDVGGQLVVAAGGAAGQQSDADITDNEAVQVAGITVLRTDGTSVVSLDNDQNSFLETARANGRGGVFIGNAAAVTLRARSGLDIGGIGAVPGDIDIEAEGTIELRRPSNPELDQELADRLGLPDLSREAYLIDTNTLRLISQGGDLNIGAQLQTTLEIGGDVEVGAASEGGTVRFLDIVGSDTNRLGDVRVVQSEDVVLGVRDVVDLDVLVNDLGVNTASLDQNGIFLLEDNRTDIFSVNTLTSDQVNGRFVLLLPTQLENTFTFNNEFFGVSILENQNGFTINQTPDVIDLSGEIAEERSQAAALFPVGPTNASSRLNNCVIGDSDDCTAARPPRVLDLVSTVPEFVFILDDQLVERLFVGFGNEELWGLPSVFGVDLPLPPGPLSEDKDAEDASTGAEGDKP